MLIMSALIPSVKNTLYDTIRLSLAFTPIEFIELNLKREKIMDMQAEKQIRNYQVAVIASLLFALLGFSYNVWRMEVTEENANTRTACFELLLVLSELEQLVYSAHYDKNIVEGSPRKGWVKAGLTVDLSVLTTKKVKNSSLKLKEVWSTHWKSIDSNEESVEAVVFSIENSRTEIKMLLQDLK